LIEAIERQDNSNVVWLALQKAGYTTDKLKDQKLKVLKIIAKSEIQRKNFCEAKDFLESAVKLSTNEKAAKELNELLVDVTKRVKVLEKKEKNMWQNAFKKGKEEPETEVPVNGTKSPNAKDNSDISESKPASLTTAKQILENFEDDFGKKFPGLQTQPTIAKKSFAKSSSQKVIKANTFTFSWSSVFPFTIAAATVGIAAFYWHHRRR
jgi:phage anti-repressor protein